MQGIPIRGDNNEDSNFIKLLRLRAKDNKRLLKWLDGKCPKYSCHGIQNEIISLLATHTIREFVGYDTMGIAGEMTLLIKYSPK